MKKVILKISAFLKRLFADAFDYLEVHASLVVDVVNNIKKVVDSPVADIITAITPTTVDDMLLVKVRAALDIVAENLLAAENVLTADLRIEKKLELLTAIIRAKTGDGRANYWVLLSGRLLMAMADGNLTLAEAVSLAQVVFLKTKDSQ